MEAVEELVDVISMEEFLRREAGNLGKLPPANLSEKPADLWNFFEVSDQGQGARDPSRLSRWTRSSNVYVVKGFDALLS